MKYLLIYKTITQFGTNVDYSIEHIEPKESKYGESWYNNCVKELSEKLHKYLRFNPTPYNLSKEELKARIESFVQSGEIYERLTSASGIHSIQRKLRNEKKSDIFCHFILINLSKTENTIEGPIVTSNLYEKIQRFAEKNDIYAVSAFDSADYVFIKLEDGITIKMTENEIIEDDYSTNFFAWATITTYESFINFQKLVRNKGVSYMHKISGGFYCFDEPDKYGYNTWLYEYKSNRNDNVTDINGNRLFTLKDVASNKIKMIREEDFYLLRLQ